jgi:hypothetical protein
MNITFTCRSRMTHIVSAGAALLSVGPITHLLNVETDKDYPIIPTFAEWQFPHQNLPAHWTRLLGEDLDTGSQPPRVDRCYMTHSSLALENAHIIPTNPADLNWFDTNIMGRYASNTSQSNTIRMKVDVHQVFDRKPQFAIIPKYGSMVAHIFNADDAIEAVRLYHNVPLQPLNGKEIRFLLSRMVWTVFPHLDLFMKARVRRKLARLVNQKQEIQETDGYRCDQIFKGARSRSVSPRKRQAGQMTRSEELEEYNEHDDDGRERDGEWPRRGRKRRRTSDDYFLPSSGLCTPCGEDLHRSGSEVSGSADAAVLTSLQT